MEENLLLKLKSGTDVRGIAVETEGSEITLTDKAVYLITKSFCKWLYTKCQMSNLTIAVGNDVRISTERILANVVKGIRESGCNAVYTGLCSTPSMFMLLQADDWDCDASIMITASHLPFDRNGLKFFTKEGGLEGSDITTILKMAAAGDFLSGKQGNYTECSYIDEYSATLVKEVQRACGSTTPLVGKKIIVDAGNGAGGFFVDKVLKPLGADVSGSQFLEPDGTFPNHIPNPEDKGAIASLSKAVIANKADLGIIFDTDVDRAGAVDCNGEEINRNRLIALMSAILLKDKSGTIVTDSVTSDGLTTFIQSLGGKHVRYKRGYKNVIDEAVRRNALGEYTPLAMETSGHAAFYDNYFLDDGAYLVTRILICLSEQAKKGERLTALISSLPLPIEEDEVRLSFTNLSKDFKAEGNRVIEDIKALASKSSDMILASDNYEGVKVNFGENDGDGWFLVRMSVHDPIMPINFESNKKGGNKIIANKLLSILKGYAFLNTQNLTKFLQND
jgi:phosphomannomutase